jgi:hypothetical protein
MVVAKKSFKKQNKVADRGDMSREKKPNSFLRQRLVSKTVTTRTTMYDVIRTLLDIVDEDEVEFIPQIILHMTNTGLLRIGGVTTFGRMCRGVKPIRPFNR